MNGSTLGAALFYAGLDWPIIPIWSVDTDGSGKARCHCGNPECGIQGKHPVSYFNGKPVVPNGIKDATCDPDLIRRWWSLRTDFNIGASGAKWFALDIDRPDARHELAGQIPDTVESISGSGGQHILFNHPSDWLVGNATGDLPDGIDVRGHGGYIILPPSMHKCGKRYNWELSSHPRDVAIADAPGWLLDILKAARVERVEMTIDDVEAPDLAVFDISTATRNRILNGHDQDEDWSAKDMGVCCALVEASASASEIAAIFHTHKIGTEGKMARHNSPESYLNRTINSAFSWTSPKTPKKTIKSKVQPQEMVNEEQAANEDRALNLAYLQGWNDALMSNPDIVPTLWPQYLTLSKETYETYGIGINYEYDDHGVADHLSAALVVPYYDGGEVTTLDTTVYAPPENYPDRIWKTDTGLSVFDIEFSRSAPIDGSVCIVGDFDEALFLREQGFDAYDILAQAADGLLGGPAKRSAALAELLANAERIVFVWPAARKQEARMLASKLPAGGQRVFWASVPADLRKMLTTYSMKPEHFGRILDMATTVLV